MYTGRYNIPITTSALTTLANSPFKLASAVSCITCAVSVMALPCAAKRSFAVVALPETARTEAVKAVVQHIRDRTLIARSDAFLAGLLSW